MIAFLALMIALLLGTTILVSPAILLLVVAGALTGGLFRIVKIKALWLLLFLLLLYLLSFLILGDLAEFDPNSPLGYTLSITLLNWFWLTQHQKDDRGTIGLILGLIGGACCIQSIGFNQDSLLINCLACSPLVIILINEFFKGKTKLLSLISCTAILTLLMGFYFRKSQDYSIQLTELIKPSNADQSPSSAKDYNELNPNPIDDQIKLPRQANIQTDHRIRAFLTTTNLADLQSLTQSKLYLRTTAFSILTDDETINTKSINQWINDADDGQKDSITTLPESSSNAPTIEYTLRIGGGGSILPLIPGTNRIYSDQVYHSAESRYLVPGESEITVIGPQPNFQQQITPIKAEANSPLLSLPNTELSDQIRNLTQQLAETGPVQDAIENYITNNCAYSLQYENPNNSSPVENLLFQERKGHCELFATATVMMLRSAGIPSRVAYGFAGGVVNEQKLSIAFRSSDMHAWAEILDQNNQWQVFDTTPSIFGTPITYDATTQQAIKWDPQPTKIDEPFPAPDYLPSLPTWQPWQLALVLLALVIGFLVTSIKFIKKGKRPNKNSESFSIETVTLAPPSRPSFITAIIELGETAGIPKPKGSTLREYAVTLQDNEIHCEEISQAIDYFYGTQYEQTKINPKKEKHLATQIRKFRTRFQKT